MPALWFWLETKQLDVLLAREFRYGINVKFYR